jgi:hypothetical protein
MVTRTFWRFLLGFLAAISISFGLIFAAGYYQLEIKPYQQASSCVETKSC